MDVHDKKTRSYNMSRIRSKDTELELSLRKGRKAKKTRTRNGGLFARGFRYRVNDLNLPGTPDLVFAQYKAVIFANGCFWHGHTCHLFKWPKSNPDDWKKKIIRNIEVDIRNRALLKKLGWRVLIVWECANKGKFRLREDELLDLIDSWLKSGNSDSEISSFGISVHIK